MHSLTSPFLIRHLLSSLSILHLSPCSPLVQPQVKFFQGSGASELRSSAPAASLSRVRPFRLELSLRHAVFITRLTFTPTEETFAGAAETQVVIQNWDQLQLTQVIVFIFFFWTSNILPVAGKLAWAEPLTSSSYLKVQIQQQQLAVALPVQTVALRIGILYFCQNNSDVVQTW